MDQDHATVGFSVSHLGISNVQGRFSTFNGDLSFVSGGASSLNFEIDADSVDTNQARRDAHIKSADFFDVDNFPKITFKSEEMSYSTSGDISSISGNLDFHGVTKAVTFTVSMIGSGEFPQGVIRHGYVATTQLRRSDFGITAFQGVVGEEIEITVNLEVIKK